MYERFTDRARKVMQLAGQESRRFNHGYIGTEHILLGLVKEETGAAYDLLKKLGIDPERIRREVEKITQPGLDSVQIGKLPQTPRAKKVLEYSLEEARYLDHRRVGTEHLLLGLIREEEGVASVILTNLGLLLEDVRERVRKLPRHNPAEESGDIRSERPARRRESSTPVLDSFGRDLTELAREGKLDPVVGRAGETEQVIEILGRPAKNNPILLGEPGVGKTTIVEGLARRIVEGLVPEFLRERRIVALDLALLIGDKRRGQFQERMKAVLNEARRAENVILFFDVFHTLVDGDDPEGVDATNLLVPALARREIQCIGESTLQEYRKYIECDGALERRFFPVIVNPPSREETLEILKVYHGRYEAHHRVWITNEAVAAAVELSVLYQPDLSLPEKAICLMDEAAAHVRERTTGKRPDFRGLESEIEQLDRGKEIAVAGQDFERAARLRDEAITLKKTRERLVREWQEKTDEPGGVVGAEAVIEVLSRQTGIPAGMIRERDTSTLPSNPHRGSSTPQE